jgi:hypothetical protein
LPIVEREGKMRAAITVAITLWATIATNGLAATPPPIYDFCAAAVTVVADRYGHAAYAGNTCDGENRVLDHLCNGFITHNGREDYYTIAMDAGCSFTAVVSHAGDAALMVTAECIVYGTMFTCLAAANAAGSGGVETISYTNGPGARTVYLVVDSHTVAGCGAYTLALTTNCTVATDLPSFGALKAAYR